MSILITGAAGFIGYHTSIKLLGNGYKVYGIDDLNDYYDVDLKKHRLKNLQKYKNFKFLKLDFSNEKKLKAFFNRNNFKIVIHLGAQAGVRYSIKNPHAYSQSNMVGFLNMIEVSKNNNVNHFIFASSSSVYGRSNIEILEENQKTDEPVSLYAASKKSNELIAYSYSSLYKMKTTGLRFFTVYGPYGRPDMSPMIFAKAIYGGKQLKIFNNGNHKRDFTYIDDIVDGILLIMRHPNKISYKNTVPYKIYNIGNNKPVNLMDYIKCLEKNIGKKAKKIFLPLQKGDVIDTYADISSLKNDFGYNPKVSIDDGISKFVGWYKEFYEN